MRVLTKGNIKHFFVGGVAALVEWLMFFLFATVLGIEYLLSTVLAFVFSTTANWILGRVTTFKKEAGAGKSTFKEALAVFVVSGIGLLFNLLLMYLFVTVCGLDSDWQQMISKVVATGIVFVWNFLIRKLLIYKVH